jgi:peptide/nickel transport system substrate-binding protein
LSEAGYPNGFEVRLDCPNDRYVNDEAICEAVVAMLARVGVKVDLLAEPKSKFFARVLAAGGYDTSFYLFGWTPATLESFNVFDFLIQCRDAKGSGGQINMAATAIQGSMSWRARRSTSSTRKNARRFSGRPGRSRSTTM